MSWLNPLISFTIRKEAGLPPTVAVSKRAGPEPVVTEITGYHDKFLIEGVLDSRDLAKCSFKCEQAPWDVSGEAFLPKLWLDTVTPNNNTSECVLIEGRWEGDEPVIEYM
ncbi:hypothetical protein [European catfish virus]|uniref:Uncharacterized protein n=1 Tax=European catfish virus TaxID=84739 RepID=I2BFW2_9VIRU|nr:hypothetical protein A190_gp132 [European catfish virus]AFJ52415.1 hypothetical protein [European catfish virus]AMZ04961.1 hypothetical protein [European catfish virus]AMZ05097.1 hypothetical protein [European catfish virus]